MDLQSTQTAARVGNDGRKRTPAALTIDPSRSLSLD
jgi:hypothetical protein